MNAQITVQGKTEFDFSKIRINSNYNIIIHCVYDPFNHFETEFEFLNDPKLDATTLLIMWHPVEMGVWDQIWISKLNKLLKDKRYKFIFLTGCTSRLDLDKHYNIKFDYRFLPVFDIRAANQWEWSPAEINVDRVKKFVCLNAKDTAHRRYILGHLCQSDLMGQGTVSYKCTNDVQTKFDDFSPSRGFTDVQLQIINDTMFSCQNMLPIIIDDYNHNNGLPRSTFLDCYVNLVNETDFINVPFGHRRSFVTEKTFNAIANNQLFIITGHAYSLEVLRDIGYKTFDGIIDESYDLIENNGERLMALRTEIERFLQRPIEQIRADYIRAVDIIKHNRDFMFSQNLNARMQEVVDRYA